MGSFLAVVLLIGLTVVALFFVWKQWTDSKVKTAKAKRDEVVAEATKRGAAVEIAGLRKSMEASMDTYTGPGRGECVRWLDQMFSSLEAKYGTQVLAAEVECIKGPSAER